MRDCCASSQYEIILKNVNYVENKVTFQVNRVTK